MLSRYLDGGEMSLQYRAGEYMLHLSTALAQFPGAVVIATTSEVSAHLSAQFDAAADVWDVAKREGFRQLKSYPASVVALSIGSAHLQAQYDALRLAEQKLSAQAAAITVRVTAAADGAES
jgi:hypothetical protein